MRYRDKWPEYSRQADAMVINPSRRGEFEQMAKYAIAHKVIYQAVETATGFPWPAVATTHKRESDAHDAHGNPLFTSYLGNGQPLNRRTTIVPIGRGPFLGPNAFVDGCVDALRIDKITEVAPPWPIEKILFWEETLNGTAYNDGPIDGRTHQRLPPMPSPYIFGGTNIQKIGKFTRDHFFDPTVMDTQLGVAGMLWTIAVLDPTVKFTRES